MTTKKLSNSELVEKLYDLGQSIINIATALKEGVPYLSDEEVVEDLHKLAMENDIPDWVVCGGSD